MNNASPTKNVKKSMSGTEVGTYIEELRFLGAKKKTRDFASIPASILSERSPKAKDYKRLSPTHVQPNGEYESLPSENSIDSPVSRSLK